MELFEASLAKLEDRLLQLGTLLAKAIDLGRGQVTADYRSTVDDLRWKHLVAQVQLDHLRSTGPEQWAALRRDVEDLCQQLEAAFEKLKRSGLLHDTSITIPCSTA